MVEPNLKFTRAEFADRLNKTRRAMEAKGIDLLVCSDPSNMNWLTGYDGWSFYVHQAVLVPPDGEPVWYGRGQDANGAKRTAYIGHENIIGYADHYVQSSERHPMDYLSQVIAERGWDKFTIGVEMDNYWFSAAAQLVETPSAKCKIRGRHSAGKLAARDQKPLGNRLYAQGCAHRRSYAPAHPRQGRSRYAQM